MCVLDDVNALAVREEYEAAETPAKAVRALDKLETIVQRPAPRVALERATRP
ncbi:HD domain-containing protein [Paraburkholderia rhizosphaerae]|uniref:HD domain-containing protein n=1 Tax=Paraburkholderia rhizosphaerae TaxID=480658 RepID=UPI001416FA55|nr:HD domain-containing protein [Paraburkholderia rhizosphaerae]